MSEPTERFAAPPPVDATASPRLRTIPAGTPLWHVTREIGHDPGAVASPFRRPDRSLADSSGVPDAGGRFDLRPEQGFSACTAALDDVTALAEVLLRDTEAGTGVRPVLAASLRGRGLEVLEAQRSLTLISLVSAEDLAAAWQDTWLIHTGPGDYAVTRRWGHWLRRCAPAADGLAWRSRHQPDGVNVLLFEDRCAGGLVPSPLGRRRLDDPAALGWLNQRLALLRTYAVPPDTEATGDGAGANGSGPADDTGQGNAA